MPIKPAAAAVLLVAVTGSGVGARAMQQGYLADGAFDVLQVLPPAPARGDARYRADRTIFRQTRAMAGGDRYRLATSDVATDQAALMRNYSCAAGVTLTPQNAPLTERLAARARVDTGRQTNAAKDHYMRLRPFLIDRGRPICQSAEQLKNSYDYPSGHTTLGWTWALVLADLLPERATAILARGRAYGASRFVCGAHNYSAVEAGYLSAGATMTAVRQMPAYLADAAAARAELRRLLADPATPRPAGCDAEAALIAEPLP